jgi:hypothetical protein
MSTQTDPIDVDDAADMILRLGGPYDPESVAAAAGLISELVRRLNHATRVADGFEYPSDVDRVIGRLNGAAAGLPQLLEQLASQLRRFQEHPRLYADHSTRDDPIAVAGDAMTALENAAFTAGRLADGLILAGSAASKLGIWDDTEGTTP